MRFKSVLIITYGRSGSTLLQGILNSIEGCLVKGENANFFYNLYQSYRSALITKSHNGTETTRPWYGAEHFDVDELLGHYCDLAKQLILSGHEKSEIKMYGFKEIRYTPNDVPDLSSYLSFLNEIFPEVALVFNIRKPEETVNSGWWRQQSKRRTKRLIKRSAKRFIKYANKHPENSFVINYTDVINKTDGLKELFKFIGAQFEDHKIDEVLVKSHSYHK